MQQQSGGDATAERRRRDSRAAAELQQSGGRATAERRQSYSRAAAELQQSGGRATAERRQSYSRAAAELQQSGGRATAERRQSYCSNWVVSQGWERGLRTLPNTDRNSFGSGRKPRRSPYHTTQLEHYSRAAATRQQSCGGRGNTERRQAASQKLAACRLRFYINSFSLTSRPSLELWIAAKTIANDLRLSWALHSGARLSPMAAKNSSSIACSPGFTASCSRGR